MQYVSPHRKSKQTQQARANPARQPAKQTQRKTRPRYRMPCTRQASENKRQNFTPTIECQKSKANPARASLEKQKAPKGLVAELLSHFSNDQN
jgi:hypothetical protein